MRYPFFVKIIETVVAPYGKLSNLSPFFSYQFIYKKYLDRKIYILA